MFLSLTDYNFRLFTIVSDVGSQKRSLLLNWSRDLLLSLLNSTHQQSLSLSALGIEILLIGEQILEVH